MPKNEMTDLITGLYPICRSITGDGVRETLSAVKKRIPLEIAEIPTGTTVFDWQVPDEWNIRDAWIKDRQGNKIVDFKKSNLHVVSYSEPVHTRITLARLRERLHTIPEKPDWIPYRTSYYKRSWGFCVTHRQFEALEPGEYEVFIDSKLEPGHLTYGELFIPGKTGEEVLITTHICHPSMCNDNLSGIAVAAELAKDLLSTENRYSYRFLFIPGTIGSITWLAGNEDKLPAIRHCMVLACMGDAGHVHWKLTRDGNAEIDRAMRKVLTDSGDDFEILPFSPYGYDERQFSSPGINLPAGNFSRSPWGSFPEYHTSADNMDFISQESLADSLAKIRGVLHLLERNLIYKNLQPKCEPQLGRRGLYAQTGGDTGTIPDQMAILWVLNQSDGTRPLLDIAERSGMPFNSIHHAAMALKEAGLLK